MIKLTMPGAQRSEVVGHPIQVIPIWRKLTPRVIRRGLRAAANPRWQWRRHVIRQVQALQRELDERLDLVRERPLRREALEVDQEHRR